MVSLRKKGKTVNEISQQLPRRSERVCSQNLRSGVKSRKHESRDYIARTRSSNKNKPATAGGKAKVGHSAVLALCSRFCTILKCLSSGVS